MSFSSDNNANICISYFEYEILLLTHQNVATNWSFHLNIWTKFHFIYYYCCLLSFDYSVSTVDVSYFVMINLNKQKYWKRKTISFVLYINKQKIIVSSLFSCVGCIQLILLCETVYSIIISLFTLFGSIQMAEKADLAKVFIFILFFIIL